MNYYFLIPSLPPLPEHLGGKILADFATTASIIRNNIHPDHLEIVHAYLQAVDAQNWEQMDQGRDLFLQGGIVSQENMIAKKHLPCFILKFCEEKERGIDYVYPYDRLWELYYEYAHAVVKDSNCRFLCDYFTWEIGLRNSLLTERILKNDGCIEKHQILASFATSNYSNIIMQIQDSSNPMEVERFLDEERLRQIYRMEGINIFTIDSLLAYLCRFSIYSRWERIGGYLSVEDYLWNGRLS